MNIEQLLQAAKNVSIENVVGDNIKQKQYPFLVEVYKKIFIPFICLFLPVLGGILSILFSRFRSWQVIFLFILDFVINEIIAVLLNLGEELGDHGNLKPILSILIAPSFVILIITFLGYFGFNRYLKETNKLSSNNGIKMTEVTEA
jgi:lipopolysaccharide export LptBFGC system permease protein LptF